MTLLATTDFDNSVDDLLFIEEVGTSEEDTLTSRNGFESDTTTGRLKKLGLSPAISGAVWASGVEFTSYTQYLVYNEVVYIVDKSTTLPVTSDTTPDSNFMSLTSVADPETEIDYDKYTQERINKFTGLVFQSVSKMQSLETLSGNVVTVEAGSLLTVIIESTSTMTGYVAIEAADVEAGYTNFLLDNGLYAKLLDYALDPETTSPIKDLDSSYDLLETRSIDEKLTGIDCDLFQSINQTYSSLKGCIGVDGLLYYPRGSFLTSAYITSYDSLTNSTRDLDVTDYSGEISPHHWVLGSDGNIYIPPNDISDANAIYIDTSDMSVNSIALGTTYTDAYGAFSSLLSEDGTAYWFYQNDGATDNLIYVLKIDTSLGLFTSFTSQSASLNRYGSSSITPDGNLIFSPVSGSTFMHFDVSTETFTEFGTITDLDEDEDLYSETLLGPDGYIYAIPYKTTNKFIVRINPYTIEVDDYEYIELTANESYDYVDARSACFAPNGLMYCNRLVESGFGYTTIEVDVVNKTVVDLENYMNDLGIVLVIDGKGKLIYLSSFNDIIVYDNLNNDQSWTKSAYI